MSLSESKSLTLFPETVSLLEQPNSLDAIKAPKFHSVEEKRAYLKKMYSGEVPWPYMNGGMGIDFSDDNFCSAVIEEGGIATLAASFVGAVEIQKQLRDGTKRSFEEKVTLAGDLNAAKLRQEIKNVREKNPYAILAVNLMLALGGFDEMLKVCGESGEVDMVMVGAGVSKDLPKKMLDYPNMDYVLIVTDSDKPEKLNRIAATVGGKMPVAYYEELPGAGGHLGADADADDERYQPKRIISEIRNAGVTTPIILAGGNLNRNNVREAYEMGANGVAFGTLLLLTKESGLPDHLILKYYLDEAYKVVRARTSPSGLPSRYIDQPEFHEYVSNKDIFKETKQLCSNCIKQIRCKFFTDTKLSDKYIPGETSYCIARHLERTRSGHEDGLFFVGEIINEIRKDMARFTGEDGLIRVPTIKETLEYSFR